MRSLLLLSLLFAAACARAPLGEADRTFVDDAGRTVRLADSIGRVVSLAPNMTELVFAAGAGDHLVAVTNADDHPPAVYELPQLGMLPVNFEAVAALEPDLVLATTQVNNLLDAQTFDALGIPAVYLSFEDVEDVFAGLRRVGALLGTAERADEAADSLARRLQALDDRMAGLADLPDVLFLIDAEELFTFGDQSYVHDMIRRAGGRSQTAGFEGEGVTLSEEYILLHPPDVILGTFSEPDPVALLRQMQPEWEALPAVRDGRVYGVEPDLVYRAGPRLIEGIWRIAALLHPDRVAAPDSVGTAP